MMISLQGYYTNRAMSWRTVCNLYTIVIITSLLSQCITSQNWKADQFQSSGDGLGFEDDDDLPMSSGSGPTLPDKQPSENPGRGQGGSPGVSQDPGRGQGNRPGESAGGNRGTPPPSKGDDLFDSWNKPPSGGNSDNSGRNPYNPGGDDDDDDNVYESSGDIIFQPERPDRVPNTGSEGRVDPPTQPPYIQNPTRPNRPVDVYPPVNAATPEVPSDRYRSSTIKDTPYRPDVDRDVDSGNKGGYQGDSAILKIFDDPLVLAGIISGAVLALMCIVLLLMFMIYRMKKKDEGSYALGEPKRTSDIRYTRTKDQEFFA